MVRVCDIYDVIHGAAPFDTALSFDNSGLLIGDGNQEVTRVLLALDITPEVLTLAKEKGIQTILTHHPVIFHPLKQVREDSPVFQLVSSKALVE